MNVYEGVDMAEVNRDLEDIANKEREAMTEVEFEAMMDAMEADYLAKQYEAESYDLDATYYGVK
jgi:hypothetical protein